MDWISDLLQAKASSEDDAASSSASDEDDSPSREEESHKDSKERFVVSNLDERKQLHKLRNGSFDDLVIEDVASQRWPKVVSVRSKFVSVTVCVKVFSAIIVTCCNKRFAAWYVLWIQ